MRPGVLIGRASTGDYDLLSTGDYINPLSSTFKLKDSNKSLVKEHELYIIIYDIEVEFIKISISGSMTTIRCFVSLNQKDWYNEIQINEIIDASEQTTIIKRFYVRMVVDDFLEYYKLTGETSYKNYKLKLVYT